MGVVLFPVFIIVITIMIVVLFISAVFGNKLCVLRQKGLIRQYECSTCFITVVFGQSHRVTRFSLLNLRKTNRRKRTQKKQQQRGTRVINECNKTHESCDSNTHYSNVCARLSVCITILTHNRSFYAYFFFTLECFIYAHLVLGFIEFSSTENIIDVVAHMRTCLQQIML